MVISLIAAMDKNHLIGQNGTLPWHLPADLKRFKQITLGKPVVMGRKTYESIGKPLPHRPNIVISRQFKNFPGCQRYDSLEKALANQTAPEIFVIGGGQLFELTLPRAHRMYLTIIDIVLEGDVYFPRWDGREWKIIKRSYHRADVKNPYSFVFLDLERNFFSL